jgi:hypothetical protein
LMCSYIRCSLALTLGRCSFCGIVATSSVDRRRW